MEKGHLSLLYTLAPFFLTYLITSLNAFVTIRLHRENSKAPLAPYIIPGIGHAFMFFVDTTSLAKWVRNVFAATTPVRLMFFHVEVSVVSGAENIGAIWRSKLLDSKPAVCMVMQRFFHMPKHALRYYYSDNSGISLRPHPASNVPHHHRLYYHTHKVTHGFMNSATLIPFSNRFQNILLKHINEQDVRSEWILKADLFSFLQILVSTSAIEAMCGPALMRLTPSWIQDFWEFDRSLPYFLKGYPQWFAPRAWRARKSILDGLKQWHAHAQAHFDESSVDKDGHDPYFGTQLIRQRQQYFGQMEFMDADAMATEDLGLIWAENANSVPVIFWFVLEMIRKPEHLARARAEVKDCKSSDGIRFDVDKLCRQPFLQSVYAETLRLRTSLFLVRGADHEDYHLKDYVFGKGKMIAIDTGAAHTDSTVWNTGDPNSPKSVDEFWAERFLINPHDRYSGPLKPKRAPETPKADANIREETSVPVFSMKGLEGAWIPFGGGARQCPGKQFAKQEIILSFAILCDCFDIKLLEQKDYEADMKYYGLGGMPVKGTVPFRIKLRER